MSEAKRSRAVGLFWVSSSIGKKRTRTNKEKGTIWEYRFFHEVLSRGHELFIPAGDNSHIDCIVSSHSGVLISVQIKGTNRAVEYRKDGGVRYRVATGTGQKSKKPLDCSRVDLVAGYIEPLDLWYLVPCKELSKVLTLWLYPYTRPSYKFEKYREAWALLETGLL